MYPDLPRIEIYVYFVSWICGVFYSIYHIYQIGSLFKDDTSGVFEQGWSFLGQRKDASDFEWKVWVVFLYTVLPWNIIHVLGAECIRWKDKKLLPLWYFTLSATFLLYFCGPIATGFLIIQPCAMYVFIQLKSRALIWVSCMGLLVLCSMENGMNWLNLPYDDHYFVLVSLAWLQLRHISFCMDVLSDPTKNLSLVNFLGYCFYFPVLFLGPIILYERFGDGISKPYMKWTISRLMITLQSLFRYIGWIFFVEFSLHYFYFNALHQKPQIVNHVGLWTLYGLGYCMGQFFMIKYFVIYGLSTTIARAEQINAPEPPKCIGRIHLYSYMWRYFDQGLYFFLSKYIYIPCLGKRRNLLRKLFASFVCFAFVYVWHNTYIFILIWSTLNFIGVTVEGICKNIGSSSVYKQWEEGFLSQKNTRRFHALLAAPLFIMSACSNFYFFGGLEIGNIFVKRIYESPLFGNSVLLVFCYFGCQVSIEIMNWEERKRNK